VPELARLLKRELQHALGARREGDLHRHKARAAADDLLNLDARLLEGDACDERAKERYARGVARRSAIRAAIRALGGGALEREGFARNFLHIFFSGE
jgi:hypothetical protein